MRNFSVLRLYALALTLLAGAASPAFAQFTPQTVPPASTSVGERYHVEASAGFWSPSADMAISSEQFDLVGDNIDFKRDLGLNDQRFKELKVVFRPAKKHKFRFQYIPIKYQQSAIVSRDLATGDNCFGIIYLGLCYTLNLQVDSTLDWKAYRFGYEYDFISREKIIAGVIFDAKYTDVQAELESPGVIARAHAAAPIPAIGGIVRGYVTPNVSITGEVTGVWLPDRTIRDVQAHYFDVEIYGTYNFNQYVGINFGYRSLDLAYTVKQDIGNFDLRGLAFGVVGRF
jgi:hypothetical protein